MGMILSTMRTITNAVAALLNPNALPPNHPNNISDPNMRAEIDNRLSEQMHYCQIGRGLLNITNARAWAREMSHNQSFSFSIHQLINLVCYTFDYSYAEIWAPHQTEMNSIFLKDYFVRNTGCADNDSLEFERSMRDMGFSTLNRPPVTMIWEVAGIAFVTQLPVWANPREVLSFSHPQRKPLISRIGFKSAFAIPVVQNGVSNFSISFYRKGERKRDMDLMHLVQGMVDEIVNGPLPIQHNPDDNVSELSVVSAA